ncbi:KTSC domain-containing protein [Mucilaginibacter ginkgonis]|uniref:KTSC domain-containing protein n=1 Tax=Mucilaginibacter ginkgonis TaxID=2682091 RepID=A0A6I4HXS2_9SPHI|nr:KTSC domain-containing protein [Mucilaginibacter ginkgonis]QQL49459.1 KTSC domain-containing protein [Mucilaginibacter ginkgonis]
MPSSVVAHMDYNEQSKNLRITYTSGMVYDYKDVPQREYNQMLAAQSKGQYLNYHIKGKYKYRKVG